MVEIALFLNDYYADLLRHTERFLAMQGALPADYAIGWQSIPTDRIIGIAYDEARFDGGDYHARLVINGSGGNAVIDTGLRMALGVLKATFDRPENVEVARNLVSAASDDIGDRIDPTDLSLNYRSPGLLIDDRESPARLINIEVRGQRWTLAESTSRVALEYVIFAIQYEARERVGERFAALGTRLSSDSAECVETALLNPTKE